MTKKPQMTPMNTAKTSLFATLVLLAFAPTAQAAGLNWAVDSFDATIQVRADGTLDITERIVADFTREAHHGIVRTMPYSYRRHGYDYNLRVHVESVTDDADKAYPYSV